MAGHSKWANIKHRKAKMDIQKAKIFTKLGKEIIVAVKTGGADPENNPRLKGAIQKAKSANMPNDNINRIIQRASGEVGGVDYEEATYEGYGPGGVAILVDIMTDNRNRTAGEIRYLFSKKGGSLGESGCVSWMFSTKGWITIDAQENKKDPEDIMLQAIECGAEDVRVDDTTVEVICVPKNFEEVKEKLLREGLKLDAAEITKIPQNTIKIEDPKIARQNLELVDALDDHDDVQSVYANYEIPDSIMAELEKMK